MKIPTIIIDDFFDYPDQIVEFANSLEYFDTDGRYPGKRTELLSEIAPFIQDYIIKRMFSQFMMLQEGFDLAIESCFQKITSDHGEGWVHNDQSIFSSIIYLNKDSQSGRGTSIMRPKHYLKDYYQSDAKFETYQSKNFTPEYERQRELCNSRFEETIRVENVYNRMILFNGIHYHRANGIKNDTSEERLTLVSFVNDMRVTASDLPESRFMRAQGI